jgi:hypothetical protein
MPFGLGALVLIGTSLVCALLLFVALKVGVLIAQRLLPAQHPGQEFLALLSRHSRSLALWSIKRIQWLLLFSLFAAGVVVTIVYS